MKMQMLLISVAALATAPALAQGAAAPARAPQPVAKSAYLQRVDASFAAVDTNKDGSIDRAEIEAAESRALSVRKAQLIKQREAAFRQLDKDKNGSLTLQEFNGPTAAQPLPKANATPMLTRLDANKDGKISAAENRTPAVAQFDRADSNKDGTLSVEEQRARRQR